MTIRVDPRAGSIEFYQPLKSLRLPVRKKLMKFGDFSFMGSGPDGPTRVGIEFKRLSDLLSCIIDKRLASHQLPGLIKTYKFRYLLIEGTISPHLDSSLLQLRHIYKDQRGKDRFGFDPVYSAITYPQMQKYLFTLENIAGVRVRFTSTRADSLGFIASLYHWWQKPWKDHHAHLSLPSHEDSSPRNISRMFRRPSVLRRIASCLPGVGWSRSQDISRRFHSVSSMVDATVEDWVKIPGIGPKTAAAIHKALRSQEKQ